MRYPPNGPRVEYFAHHESQWAWIGHLIGLLVFAAVVALVVVLVLRLLNRSSLGAPVAAVAAATPAAPPPDDPALAQLRLRYAQGGVSREDYLRIASDLGAPVPSPGSPDSGGGSEATSA